MTDPSSSESLARTLRRIATALNCTVEELTNGKDPVGDLAETRELLTLWSAIGRREGRQIVLEAAREVVRSQAGA